MLKGIIIEDEKRDAAQLQQILKQLQPGLSCKTFYNGAEAIAYLKRRKEEIDIFFIDRELPGMDGFTAAAKIREMNQFLLTPMVFVTGYAMGQLDAFQEYHCYSYLVKPISGAAVKKQIGTLLENLGKGRAPKKLKRIIPIMAEHDLKLVDADSILGLEAMGRDCYLYVGKQKLKLIRQTLDMALKEINEPYCIRCHKSFALNLKNVTDISKVRRNIWKPTFSRETSFDCEISKTRYDEVMKRYKEFLSQQG